MRGSFWTNSIWFLFILVLQLRFCENNLGFIAGGNHVKISGILSVKSGGLVKTQQLSIRSKTRSRANRSFSVRAQYKYES